MEQGLIIQAGITGFAALGSGLILWLMQRSIKEIDGRQGEHAERIEANRTRIGHLEVKVAEGAAVSASIASRLDSMQSDMRELKQDVKELIRRG